MSKDEAEKDARSKKILEEDTVFDRNPNRDNDNDDTIYQADPRFEEPQWQRTRTDDERAEEALKNKTAFDERRTSNADTVITNRKEAVAWIDKHYASVVIDGKYRIINERDPSNIRFMTKRDFVDSLYHLSVTILSEDNKSKNVPITELWLKEQKHRDYTDGIIFDPRRKYVPDDGASLFNMWRGFAIEPRPGDVTRFIDYSKNIVVSGNQEHVDWALDWVSHIFQKPWEKPGTSIVLRGIEGIGKSFFAEAIGHLISGRKNDRKNSYYFKTSNPEHVMNHFNDHLANILLLHMEETFWAGDKKGAHHLKELITGDDLSIGQKHLSTRMSRSYMRMIMNGNDDWLVPAGLESRRFAVFDVSDELRQNTAFYKDMAQWLNAGGLEALMYYFLHREIKNDVRIVPITDALIEQRVNSMSPEFKWWNDIMINGQLSFFEENNDGISVIRKRLHQMYEEEMKRMGYRGKLLSETDLGIRLRHFLPKVVNGVIPKGDKGRDASIVSDGRISTKGPRPYFHILPPLAICREAWDFRLGRKWNYEEPYVWEKLPYDNHGAF